MAWMLEGEWIHLWLSSSDLFLKGGRGLQWRCIVLYCTVTRNEQVLLGDDWPQLVIYHFSLSFKDKALGHVILSGLASVILPLNVRG